MRSRRHRQSQLASGPQLLHELAHLRARVAALQVAVARCTRAELLAEEARCYAESVIEAVHEPLLVLDAEMTVRSANPAFYETFADTPATTLGRRVYSLGNGQWDIAALRTLLEEVLPESKRIDGFEVTHQFEAVGLKIMRLNARQIFQDKIGTQTILLAIEDVTLRRQLEERLLAASITDELTGLYDRRGLFVLGEKLLQLAARQERGCWALYLDLDGLKRINDTGGHQEGDRALADCAKILRDTFRGSDVVARVGGDEFVVLSIVAAEDSSEAGLSRLHGAVAGHNKTSAAGYELSLSVGIARCAAGCNCSIDELLRQGDAAMYEAKRARAEPPKGHTRGDAPGRG